MRDDVRGEGERDTLDEVAQVLSHDLANLLVIAQSSLELARRQHDDEHLERTAAVLENAEELTDDVVTLARTGQQADDVEPVTLEAVAEQAWHSVDDTGATLHITGSTDLEADPGWLRLLLENLLKNAVKHGSATRDPSETAESADPTLTDITIEVGCLQRDAEMGFYVADDGVGFTAEDPNRAFESGYSTTEEQSGLGLSIVRRIADAHGWSITLTESAAGGARIEFTGVNISGR